MEAGSRQARSSGLPGVSLSTGLAVRFMRQGRFGPFPGVYGPCGGDGSVLEGPYRPAGGLAAELTLHSLFFRPLRASTPPSSLGNIVVPVARPSGSGLGTFDCRAGPGGGRTHLRGTGRTLGLGAALSGVPSSPGERTSPTSSTGGPGWWVRESWTSQIIGFGRWGQCHRGPRFLGGRGGARSRP